MVVQKARQGAKDSYAYSYPINSGLTAQQAFQPPKFHDD